MIEKVLRIFKRKRKYTLEEIAEAVKKQIREYEVKEAFIPDERMKSKERLRKILEREIDKNTSYRE